MRKFCIVFFLTTLSVIKKCLNTKINIYYKKTLRICWFGCLTLYVNGKVSEFCVYFR